MRSGRSTSCRHQIAKSQSKRKKKLAINLTEEIGKISIQGHKSITYLLELKYHYIKSYGIGQIIPVKMAR